MDVCGNHVIISRFFSQKETCEQMFSKGKHTSETPENYSFCLFNLLFLLFLLFFYVIARYQYEAYKNRPCQQQRLK